MARPRSRTYRRLGLSGLLVFVLAMLGQVFAPAFASPSPDSFGPMAALGVICHAGGLATGDRGTPAPQRAADCTTCPLCGGLGAPFALLPPASVTASPRRFALIRLANRVQARAPPAPVLAIAWPRGPPALS